MKLSIISFTGRGMELSIKIQRTLKDIMSLKEEPTAVTEYNACDRENSYGDKEFLECKKEDINHVEEDLTWNKDNDEIFLYTKHKSELRKNESKAFPGKEYSECLTKTDQKLNNSLNEMYPQDRIIPYVKESLGEWTKEKFQQHHALIFIGACGIAVRAIAPFVQDKLKDSPVIVIDEGGGFVIPILSGHYGGANELARKIAERIGATAVITTATDVNGLFAVDEFAKKNNLWIRNREGIEKVSSKILAGEKVTISCENQSEDFRDLIPPELTWQSYDSDKYVSILISPYSSDERNTDLQLCPKIFAIGIGCRKGKTFEELEAFVSKQLQRAGIQWEEVYAISSIDRKKEEAGIIELAKHHNLPFCTYDAITLNELEGNYISSFFVKSQVGVDNVCERAAIACGGEGSVIKVKKSIENGMTMAIAERRWRVRFDEA